MSLNLQKNTNIPGYHSKTQVPLKQINLNLHVCSSSGNLKGSPSMILEFNHNTQVKFNYSFIVPELCPLFNWKIVNLLFSFSNFSYRWSNILKSLHIYLWPHYTGQIQFWLLCLIQFLSYKPAYSSWKQGHQYPRGTFFHFHPRKIDLWYIIRLSIYTNAILYCRSMSPLAELYSTSTLEHHHFDQCIMILSTKVCIIFWHYNCI